MSSVAYLKRVLLFYIRKAPIEKTYHSEWIIEFIKGIVDEDDGINDDVGIIIAQSKNSYRTLTEVIYHIFA